MENPQLPKNSESLNRVRVYHPISQQRRRNDVTPGPRPAMGGQLGQLRGVSAVAFSRALGSIPPACVWVFHCIQKEVYGEWWLTRAPPVPITHFVLLACAAGPGP